MPLPQLAVWLCIAFSGIDATPTNYREVPVLLKVTEGNIETTDEKFRLAPTTENGGKLWEIMQKEGESLVIRVTLHKHFLYYLSKIRLIMDNNNWEKIKSIEIPNYTTTMNPKTGSLLFETAQPIREFDIEIYPKHDTEWHDLKTSIGDIHFYPLAPRTRRFMTFTDKNRTYDESRDVCSRHGGFLTSKWKISKSNNLWLGLEESRNMTNGENVKLIWADGDAINATKIDFSADGNMKPVYSQRGIIVRSNPDSPGVEALCGFSDDFYYLLPVSASCSTEKHRNGIQVTPSSTYEIKRINTEFPGQDLEVAMCNSPLPSYYNKEDYCDSSSNTRIVLSSDGTVKKGRADKKICKASQIAGNGWIYHDTDNNISSLLNYNFGEKPLYIEEVGFLVKYKEENEDDLLQVLITCTLKDKKEQTTEDVISLSKDRTRDFQIVRIGKSCYKLNISWNTHIEMWDEHIRNLSYALIINDTSPSLTSGGEVELFCITDMPYHVQVSWTHVEGTTGTGGELLDHDLEVDRVGGRNIQVDNHLRYASTVKVNSTGAYRCMYNNFTSKTVNVVTARVCHVADLENVEHVDLEHLGESLKAYETKKLNCSEGYTTSYSLTCLEGGNFKIHIGDTEKPKRSDICGRLIDVQMDELEDLYKSDDTQALGVSEKILELINGNGFHSNTDKMKVTSFIKRITQDTINGDFDKSDQKKICQTNLLTMGVLLTQRFDVTDTEAKMMVLDTVDYIGEKGTPITFSSTGMALLSTDKKPGDSDNTTFTFYNKFDPRDIEVATGQVKFSHDPNSSSVNLPVTAGKRVWFTVYNSSLVKLDNDSTVASHVISASTTETLGDDFTATITLKKSYYGADPRCVFWNGTGWSTEGVTVIANKDEYVVCRTVHLTNFAVLMTRDDSFIPRTHEAILNFISIGGCTVSCVCLVLTIIGLVRFKEVREMTDSKIHIHFSVSLLLALLVFLIFVDLTEYSIVCISGAMMLHFFLLTSVCWMLCEAVNLYLTTFTTFTNNNHLHLMTLFAWGIPAFVVGMAALNTMDNYRREGGDFCWLETDAMMYWFGMPVILIAILNFVLYILVIKSLAKNARNNRQSSITDLRSCFAMIIVLGATWVFGFFTMLTKILMFQYLFAISNSLQGFCVFYCYCGSKRHVIVSWKNSKTTLTQIQDEYTTDTRVVTTKVESVTPIRRSPYPNNNWFID